MVILQNKNGKIEIRKDNSSLVRAIYYGNAILVDLTTSQTYIAFTTAKKKLNS